MQISRGNRHLLALVSSGRPAKIEQSQCLRGAQSCPRRPEETARVHTLFDQQEGLPLWLQPRFEQRQQSALTNLVERLGGGTTSIVDQNKSIAIISRGRQILHVPRCNEEVLARRFGLTDICLSVRLPSFRTQSFIEHIESRCNKRLCHLSHLTTSRHLGIIRRRH